MRYRPPSPRIDLNQPGTRCIEMYCGRNEALVTPFQYHFKEVDVRPDCVCELGGWQCACMNSAAMNWPFLQYEQGTTFCVCPGNLG